MTTPLFWLLCALMVVAALAGLLPPLLRRQPAHAAASDDANLALLREQGDQLAADREDGLLDAAQYAQAHRELARRTLDETETTAHGADTRAGAAPASRSAALITLGLPLLALAIYQQLGTPAALFDAPSPPAAASLSQSTGTETTPSATPSATTSATPPATASIAGPATPTDAAGPDVEAMVARLAQRLQSQPDDGPGWQMLARSYATLGRFEEASQAYARAARLLPDDAQLLADQADALAMAQGRSALGEPTRLVERALKLAPDNLKALAIAGNAALERGDMAAAQGYFERAQQAAAAISGTPGAPGAPIAPPAP